MSEFKFACPVCRQHITADSGDTGTQIECPTCFQKIVVPQAPTAESQKFILSATMAGAARTSKDDAVATAGERPARRSDLLVWIALAVVFIGAASAGVYYYRHRPPPKVVKAPPPSPPTNPPPPAPVVSVMPSPHPIPTNVAWILSITNAPMPEEPVVGAVRGQGFKLERSTFQGGSLSLRQGKAWPPDFGVTIVFPAHRAEEFSGKTVEVWPDRPPPIPRVTLRWKDVNQQPRTKEYRGGYALKAVFAHPADGKLPGKVYLALPDNEHSFLAGSFVAEIRTNAPPQKKGGKKAPTAASLPAGTNLPPDVRTNQ